MSDNWKDDIIKNKLGGKKEWTDQERMELSRQLDKDLDKHLDSLEPRKVQDAWTEDNWKEKMSEHPIFAPYLHEGDADLEAPENELSEGLAQLKYDPDHNTPPELALAYKDEGIFQFKYKKYRLAIANFSEGLKQKCSDCELNAKLYNNRAAANWHLGNYRSCIKDCCEALKLKPDYLKALQRGIECFSKLNSWDEMICWCDRGLLLDPASDIFTKARIQALKGKKIEERNKRKGVSKLSKETIVEKKVLDAIIERKICLRRSLEEGNEDLESSSLSMRDLKVHHPTVQDVCVQLNENGELIWPVVLSCPEHKVSEYIVEFNENDCFADHLECMFGTDVSPPPWDGDEKYKSNRIRIFYEDVNNKLVKVESNATLKTILSDSRYIVIGGAPLFFILVDGQFMDHFLQKHGW